VAIEALVGPTGYHDVAFDGEGHIVGFDGFNIMKTTASGPPEVFATGLSYVQGMDYLPGGDLVAATSAYGLARITPAGTVTSIAPALSSIYGVTVGPDGMVYCSDESSVYRVDPADGTYDVIASGMSPRGVDFSPDLTRMYITSGGGLGRIFVAYLDDELNLIDAPTILTTIPGAGTYLDGIRVDACGNLWIPNYNTSNLYRVSSEGVVTLYYDWPDLTGYGHGIKWGSGVGGWDDMSIFMPQPYGGNTVVRFEVGVHYRE
jgi:sugar lactone lactonase YvrE